MRFYHLQCFLRFYSELDLLYAVKKVHAFEKSGREQLVPLVRLKILLGVPSFVEQFNASGI